MSSALGALTASSARFERAAVGVASSTTVDPTAMAAGGVATGEAMVSMAAAQFALMASVRAAEASTEMVAQVVATYR